MHKNPYFTKSIPGIPDTLVKSSADDELFEQEFSKTTVWCPRIDCPEAKRQEGRTEILYLMGRDLERMKMDEPSECSGCGTKLGVIPREVLKRIREKSAGVVRSADMVFLYYPEDI